MPIVIPPQQVVEAFTSGTTHHTRRVDLYEADGSTPWMLGAPLIGGSVGVDYGRDERRTLDLSLDNSSRVFVNEPGELWYDKIVKVYRGVEIKHRVAKPRIAIVSDITDYNANDLRGALGGAGYTEVKVYYPAAQSVTIGELQMFDIVVFHNLTLGDTTFSAMSNSLYHLGVSVFVVGQMPTSMRGQIFPSPSTAMVTTSHIRGVPVVTPARVQHPLASGWSGWSFPQSTTPKTYTYIASVPTVGSGAIRIAAPDPTSLGNLLIARSDNPYSGMKRAAYLDFDQSNNGIFEQNDFREFIKAIMDWLNPVTNLTKWEVQIGEFMIDRISEDNFPRNISITGRDYTKKCIRSKFAYSTKFEKGIYLEDVIGSIAAAAGITKRILPSTGVVVNKSFYFDRGVTRWEAMRDITAAYDYSIFFDAQGFLTIAPVADPSLNDPIYTFKTGYGGVIAKFSKSTSDTRIYNHVVVTGESSDPDTIPVTREARNENPQSPTSIAKIGERTYEYVSSFITTGEQAQRVADSFLAAHALEEYEVSFDTLMLPWLDVGDSIRFVDPNPASDDPDVYLFSSLTIPLSLGPMSSSAKRVIKVV